MAQAEIRKTYNDIGLGGPIKTFLNDTLWLQVVADMHSETGIYFSSSLWKCRSILEIHQRLRRLGMLYMPLMDLFVTCACTRAPVWQSSGSCFGPFKAAPRSRWSSFFRLHLLMGAEQVEPKKAAPPAPRSSFGEAGARAGALPNDPLIS
ncbi:hypothetical protein ACP70R_035573 [Stipagrostis hirtigluma subsp. patula]